MLSGQVFASRGQGLRSTVRGVRFGGSDIARALGFGIRL